MNSFIAVVLVLSFVGYGILGLVVHAWLRLRRAEFIRTYKLPRGLLASLAHVIPAFHARNARWSRAVCASSSSPT